MEASMANQTALETPAIPKGPADLEAPASPKGLAEAHRPGLKSALILTGTALGLAVLGLYLYVPGLYEVATNDAYVDAHMVSVVPKVAAYVSALHVDDNSKIMRGDLLVELDTRDFQVAVEVIVHVEAVLVDELVAAGGWYR